MEQQSYLSDLEFNPVLASTGKRFVNHLIDVIIFDVIAILIRLGFFYASTTYFVNDLTFILLRYLVTVSFAIVYYFLAELIFKGRTIGKFITGTKAVNEDGTEMDTRTILIRSLSRAVPFEVFSALGNPCHPWHDRWSKTYVIDIKQTTSLIQ